MDLKLASIVFMAVICAITAQNLPTKFDRNSIEVVLSNDRVLTNYINCLLDKGNCTRAGRELKDVIPSAIRGECSKCTDTQKRNLKKVISFLRTRRPQDWKALTDKYDPQGIFKQNLDKIF